MCEWSVLRAWAAVTRLVSHLRLVCDEKTHVSVFNFCWSWPDDLPGHFAEKSRVRPLGMLNNLGILYGKYSGEICRAKIPRMVYRLQKEVVLFQFRLACTLQRMTFCCFNLLHHFAVIHYRSVKEVSRSIKN